jgi:hypothetical protein
MLIRALIAAVLATAAAYGAPPAGKHEPASNKLAGKYAYCRQKVEAKYAETADPFGLMAALQKCLDRYNAKSAGPDQAAIVMTTRPAASAP